MTRGHGILLLSFIMRPDLSGGHGVLLSRGAVAAEKRAVCTNRRALHLWLAPPPFLATLLASRKSQGLYPHPWAEISSPVTHRVLQTRTRGTSLHFIPQTDALSWVPFLPKYAGKLKLYHPSHRTLATFSKLRAAAPVREQQVETQVAEELRRRQPSPTTSSTGTNCPE